MFMRFVRRSPDRRLERTLGSDRGLRLIFRAMAKAYRPECAGGWTGDIRYELAGAQGAVRVWTVSCGLDAARAREGAAPAPDLTVKIGVADFLRVAAREVDPAKALLSGRMDLEGDFSVAMRLGEMFGQPPVY